MIYLILSILTSSLFITLIKWMERWHIALLPTITINYWICVLWGTLLMPTWLNVLFQKPLAVPLLTLLQGILFIAVLVLMAYAILHIGIGYTALLSKISVVIPVSVAIFYFHEPLTLRFILGMLCALLAIVFLHLPLIHTSQLSQKHYILGFSLFLGSGIIDTNFKLLQQHYHPPSLAITTGIFFTAGCIGSILWSIKHWKIHFKMLMVGIGLGTLNFFSIVFLMLALKNLPASLFFPLNNIGILVLTTFLGVVWFQERFSSIQWLGILAALMAIYLLATY